MGYQSTDERWALREQSSSWLDIANDHVEDVGDAIKTFVDADRNVSQQQCDHIHTTPLKQRDTTA